MLIASASSPAMFSRTMRRVRLDDDCATRKRQVATEGAKNQRTHLRATRHFTPPERTSATAGAVSAVRSSTLRSRPRSSAPRSRALSLANLRGAPTIRANVLAQLAGNAKAAAESGFLETIADAVKRLDHVEVVVRHLELLAQALDVAVDGAVIDI